MEVLHSITIDDIRTLRSELMDSLDELSDLEHRFQQAEGVARKAGKVVETIRSRQESQPPQIEQQISESESSQELKFLSVADVAKRWGCSSMTVNRMVRNGILPKTYLSSRIVRISLEDIERYEADCRA